MINLELRYPDSKPEDITDAYNRGVLYGMSVGRGTCRLESMHGYTDPYVTTRYVVELSCHTLDDWPESEPPAYCPWCGAKVVED